MWHGDHLEIRRPTVSLSSTQVEYIAISEVPMEILYVAVITLSLWTSIVVT